MSLTPDEAMWLRILLRNSVVLAKKMAAQNENPANLGNVILSHLSRPQVKSAASKLRELSGTSSVTDEQLATVGVKHQVKNTKGLTEPDSQTIVKHLGSSVPSEAVSCETATESKDSVTSESESSQTTERQGTLDTSDRRECQGYCVSKMKEMGVSEKQAWALTGKWLKEYSLNGSYQSVVDGVQYCYDMYDVEPKKFGSVGYIRSAIAGRCRELDDKASPVCPMCGMPSRPVDGRPGEFRCINPNNSHGFSKNRR